jgi:hypothetical protein
MTDISLYEIWGPSSTTDKPILLEYEAVDVFKLPWHRILRGLICNYSYYKYGFENCAKFWIHWGWSLKPVKTSVMGNKTINRISECKSGKNTLSATNHRKNGQNSTAAWFWQDQCSARFVLRSISTMKLNAILQCSEWMIAPSQIVCENIQICICCQFKESYRIQNKL